MPFMSPEEAQAHRLQALAEQVAITRAIAATTMTPASLLAYARAELARCATLPLSDEDDEPPF